MADEKRRQKIVVEVFCTDAQREEIHAAITKVLFAFVHAPAKPEQE